MPVTHIEIPKTLRDDCNTNLGIRGIDASPPAMQTDVVIPVWDYSVKTGIGINPSNSGLVKGWAQKNVLWPIDKTYLYSTTDGNSLYRCIYPEKYLRLRNFFCEIHKSVAIGEGDEHSSIWVDIRLELRSDPDATFRIARWMWDSYLTRPAVNPMVYTLFNQSNVHQIHSSVAAGIMHRLWPVIEYQIPGEGLPLNQSLEYLADYGYDVIIQWGDIFNTLHNDDELQINTYCEHDPAVILRNI